MRQTFDNLGMQWIEAKEGYISDVAGDPGGYTIFGISTAYNPDAVKVMKGMDKDAAREYAAKYYLNKYWLHNGCDDLPWPLDLVHFDCCVNPGHGFLDQSKDWAIVILLRQIYWQGKVNGHWKDRGGWVNRGCDLTKMILGVK